MGIGDSRHPAATFLALRRDRLGTLEQAARELGDPARFRVLGRLVFLLVHPDLIREAFVAHESSLAMSRAQERARCLLGDGLLTSDGAVHDRERRRLLPAFRPGSVAALAEAVAPACAAMTDGWRDGADVDAHAEMSAILRAYVTRSLLDYDASADAHDLARATSVDVDLMGSLAPAIAERAPWLPLPNVRRWQAQRAYLRAFADRVVCSARESQPEVGHLMRLVLAGQDGDLGLARDHALTFYLTGTETLASALSWSWHLLGSAPAAADRLSEEARSATRSLSDAALDASALPFARAVLTEALRLYPPAPIIGRAVKRSLTLGGQRIVPGTSLLASPWVTHRDERFFHEALAFRPERWQDGSVTRPQAYFPFGVGPRRCIGEAFAWQTGVLVLATIARQWRLHPTVDRVELDATVTLRPRGGLPMRLERLAG